MRHTKQNETHEWAQKISWGVLSCNGTLEIFNCFSQNKLCIFNKWQFQSLPKLVIVLSHNLQMKELLFWAGRRKGEENWLFNPVVGLLAGDKGHIFIPVDVYSIINTGLQPMCSRENHWRGSFSLAQRVLISCSWGNKTFLNLSWFHRTEKTTFHSILYHVDMKAWRKG